MILTTSQAQGSYYGEQEARLGHFPSSVVEETHAIMPAEVEVKTDVSTTSGILRNGIHAVG